MRWSSVIVARVRPAQSAVAVGAAVAVAEGGGVGLPVAATVGVAAEFDGAHEETRRTARNNGLERRKRSSIGEGRALARHARALLAAST